MQIIDGQFVYSATDLVGFLACEHLTNLERAAAEGKVQRPMRRDPELDRIAARGLQHEQRFLRELALEQRTVAAIESETLLGEAVERTIEAMRRGIDVVYQGALFDGRRRGHPDFLIKVEKPSALGAWSYEAWDTKLARHAKGSAVLQLSLYTDLLESVQGIAPEHMTLALGGSAQEKATFRSADYGAYYRLIKTEFERATAGAAAWPIPTRPDPVEHCDVCRWSEECRKRLRADDDLSLVAGITSNQRRQLRERAIVTRAGVAQLSLPLSLPLKGGAGSWVKVREQARIQVQGEQAGKVTHEILDPPRLKNGELEPEKGLMILPEPSEGDLFFDIEGDPFALDDGVDYLFGVLEPRLLDDKGQPTFHTFWSIDGDGEVTFEAERTAFEAFVDLVMDRLEQDPNLHVYHYHHYEPTAVKRLMGRYGTREDEVDKLLRSGVFVDLHRAVRQGVRASVEGYSIKNLEPLYSFERTVGLRDAGSSIAAFEEWLELGGNVPDNPHILERIRDYNHDDCVSNGLLRDWLEQQRAALAAKLGVNLPRPGLRSGDPSEKLREDLDETESLADRLSAGVAADPVSRSVEEQARWLLAQLLHWHRREDKSSWWRYFYLMNDLTDEERTEEPDALGGLTPLGRVRTEKQSAIYRFKYPPQDHKVGEGTSPHDPATGKSAGTVTRVDDGEAIIEIRRAMSSGPPKPSSLVPQDVISSSVLSRSLRSIARWVAEHSIDEPGDHRAARDLLLRRPPRFSSDSGGGPCEAGASAATVARQRARQLESSYLAVQGPPGSGKSTVGAEMIVNLVQEGRRIGVTANSHKVIGGLLEKAAEIAAERGVGVAIGQKPRNGEPCTFAGAQPLDRATDIARMLARGEVDVVGGTAWLWSSEEMRGTVDFLFIDEAGQMSLANALASSPCAANLVLLGDPQQLDQPLKGVHPPGADRSALGHLLGEHETIPHELGVFLDGTWRLHPDICDYTSEVFYEGRLSSQPGREAQAVRGDGALAGTGLRFISVEHEGHTTTSEEEAQAVARLIRELLDEGATWVDERGSEESIRVEDVLVVAPYNAHVAAILAAMPEANAGTVDKFQGREAPVSIYSMATSSAADAPRGMEFLYSLNRLNVATSRARCLTAVVASPHLLRVRCKTPRQMRLANALARFVEFARGA